MSSPEDFFLDNPWGGIAEPCYPYGRRLYLNDERFWVSIDENNHCLFFVQDHGGESVKPLENIAGLDVGIEDTLGGEQRLVCRLTETDPEAVDKFATIAKDIAFHCSKYEETQLFVKTQERIKSWANFLRPSRKGLTNSEFIGFFGELYVLAVFMKPYLSATESVKAWIGPDGSKQDFTLDDWALEVKTSISGEQQTVRISSLDQLDRVTRKLYLLRVIAIPASEGGGLSLGDLYKSCLDSVRHDVVTEGLFLQKASGLYGKASEVQIDSMFKVAGVFMFDVVPAFPKLTRHEVDSSISGVSYEIAFSALLPFQIDADLSGIVKNG